MYAPMLAQTNSNLLYCVYFFNVKLQYITIVFCYLPMVDIVIINITQLICLSSRKSALLTNKVFFGIKKNT